METIRHSDRITLIAYLFLIFQLCFWVVAARAQSQETINAVESARVSSIDARISTLEAMNLPSRMAVLEQSVSEIREIRTIVYGIFATFIGALVLQVVQVKQARQARQPPLVLK